MSKYNIKKIRINQKICIRKVILSNREVNFEKLKKNDLIRF